MHVLLYYISILTTQPEFEMWCNYQGVLQSALNIPFAPPQIKMFLKVDFSICTSCYYIAVGNSKIRNLECSA